MGLELFLICAGWVTLVVGFLGCFIPMLPGPPIAYCALLLAVATGDHTAPSVLVLMGMALLTTVVTVLDYVVPAWGAAKFNCSRLGTVGCFIGTIVGLFFLPVGVIVGPFFGALIGETSSGKNLGAALVGAIGALIGFLVGVVMKVACCGAIAYYFWVATVR